ncbi:MAG TPA: aminotransferase class I/II-fold pyridoxal phosphate-dependent enzyme [Candidatus Peribacteraceae bacterium]|nr:aminotransferase class I/II-fold pyridoxal phosphate-dependent enzyme [Candidatus Peribacteraceae bacterium]
MSISGQPPYEYQETDRIFYVDNLARKAGKDAFNLTTGTLFNKRGGPYFAEPVHDVLRKIGPSILHEAMYESITKRQAEFAQVILDLLFKEEIHAATFASHGGSGALRYLLEFMKSKDSAFMQRMKITKDMPVIVPDPSWPNHEIIAEQCGYKVLKAQYLDNNEASIEDIIDVASDTRRSCILLLQAACHNPTGKDLTVDQWTELAMFCAEKGHIPLLDISFPGFVGEPWEDAYPSRIFSKLGVGHAVGVSASKAYCIQGWRAGLACIMSENEKQRQLDQSQLTQLSEALPLHADALGAFTIRRVQKTRGGQMLKVWRDIRLQHETRRQMLHERIPEWTPYLNGNAHFVLLPYTQYTLNRMQKNAKIYLAKFGADDEPGARLNLGRLQTSRMDEFVEKIQPYKEEFAVNKKRSA